MQEFIIQVDMVEVDKEGGRWINPTEIILNETTIRQLKGAMEECEELPHGNDIREYQP